MSIEFNNDIFNLQTPNTSYIIGIYKEKLLHLYYGKRIENYKFYIDNMPVRWYGTFIPTDIEDSEYYTGTLPIEYPVYGSGDFRTPAFHAEYTDGSAVTNLDYVKHDIFKGKKALIGLPAIYTENDNEAETLEITLFDNLTGLEIILSYTVYEDYDAISKSVRIKNTGSSDINVKSIMSTTTHLFDKNYDFVHLPGSWARERHIQKVPLCNGTYLVDSKRVSSSHHHSPFMALARPETTETSGEVYGYSLLYSGNFIAQAEVDSYDSVRLNMGINPFGFNWLLKAGEEFTAPEVVCTYSSNGFGEMSRTFHRLYRTRLVRGKYRDIARPILINNWEATYFDFNEDKILNIAQKAQSAGVELMVLDDGWFGKRNSDNCSLGDWFPDYNKLPNGIKGLADKLCDMGMKFGLWIEPEMISEDSELYRKHPDWCIHINGRRRTPSRSQFVLDLSRKEIRDYIVYTFSSILSETPISYIKWDMNRNISEIGSAGLPVERQQELPHRYVLGVYEILERLTSAFPDVLFEGCSGGGGRFDAGMLYYFPQYWTSDNTDSIERLYIQHGTSMVMPPSTMTSHVSSCPNPLMQRVTPITTLGHVSMSAQLGYELDLSKLSDDEFVIVKHQIKEYKEIRDIIHHGDMYRLKSPFEDNNCAWEYVSPEKDKIVLMYCTILGVAHPPLTCVKLNGLDKTAIYREKHSGKEYYGEYLMNVGLYFEDNVDFVSHMLVFEKL